MTPLEIHLVRTSFQKVEPIADQTVALFYARLFELDPSLRMLFHGDMVERGRQLMQMIGQAVAGLDRLDTVIPTIRQLGLRHAGYHVREDHYDTFGEALLWTLGKGLNEQFTADTRAAWAKVYWVLAETMKAGARDGTARMNRAGA